MSQDFDWLDGPSGSSSPKSSSSSSGGGWHVLLTVMTLLATALVSFGIAWLTRYTPQRSIVTLGLTFALPTLIIMCTALFLEAATNAMTPRYSRKGQLGVAAIAVLVSFIIGCFGESISGLTRPQITPVPPTPTPTPTATPVPVPDPVNYILLVDKSGSMMGSFDDQSKKAVSRFLSGLSDDTKVAMIAFTHEILGEVDLSDLNAAHRRQLDSLLNLLPDGGTDFTLVLTEALSLLDSGDTKTSVIMVTDGADDITKENKDRLRRGLQAHNASLSCIKIGLGASSESLDPIINATKGKSLTVKDVTKLYESLEIIAKPEPTPSPSPTPKPTPTPEPIVITDVLREASQHRSGRTWRSFAITSSIMLVAEGLVIGLALTIMLSRENQRKWQWLISLLMGGVAAVLLNVVTISPAWLQEALAFSCYGLVFMRKNNG